MSNLKWTKLFSAKEKNNRTVKNRLDAYLARSEITMCSEANVERLKTIFVRSQRDRAVDFGFFAESKWNSFSTCDVLLSSLLLSRWRRTMAWRRFYLSSSRRPRNPTTTGLVSDFFVGAPSMRAHLRQIVNTFIHVRQRPSIVFHSTDPVDNETGAFSSGASRKEGREVADIRAAKWRWDRSEIYLAGEDVNYTFVKC